MKKMVQIYKEDANDKMVKNYAGMEDERHKRVRSTTPQMKDIDSVMKESDLSSGDWEY